jgi:beta-lactamase regulating signal transducer with metallopeptidase domain
MSRTRASTAWFVHELAHGKRRDHVVVWIELAAGVIW